MLLARHGIHFIFQQSQRFDEFHPRLPGLDHIVHKPALGRHKWIREPLLELLDLLLAHRLRIGRAGNLTAIHNVHRAFRTHDRNFRRWIGVVHISSQVLGPHHAIRAAIGLTRDHRDLGHGRLGVRIQQLRTVTDDATELLLGARQESWHVLERHDRDVERIAKPNEPGALCGRIYVQAPGKKRRLIGHDSNGTSIEPREADYDVLRPMFMDFEERPIIDHAMNDFLDVIRDVRFHWHDRIQRGIGAVNRIGRGFAWHGVLIVLRQVRHQLADHQQALGVIVRHEVRDSADRVVRARAAELLFVDILVRDRFDYVGPGDEHMRRVLDHENEVGQGRGVDRSTRARAHDC